MTVIRPNSISGITSITAQANEINVFRSDGTLAGLQLNGVNFNNTSGISTLAALNVTGNVSVGGTLTYQDVTNIDSVGIITARAGINVSGGQLDVGSNIKLGNAGVITATTFVGNLTGEASALGSSVFASGPFNNRIVTTTGGNNLNPEIGLQFDGTSILELQPTSATPAIFVGDSNRTGAGQHLTEYRGNWNGTLVGRIIFAAGDDTTNKDDGIITMHTTPSGGSSTERLRIKSNGNIGIGTINPEYLDANFKELTISGGSEGAGLHLQDDNANVVGGFFTSDNTNAMIIRTRTNHPLIFRTNNVERLRIDSSGKVSIASGVYGGGGTVPELYVKGTSGRQMKIHNSNAGTSSLQITNATTGEGEDAGTQLFTQGSTGDFYISNQYASGDISFNTRPSGGSNTNRLTIQSDGHIISGSNNTQNFGSSSNIWAGIFANYARLNSNLAVGSSGLQSANVASFKGNNYNQVNITHSAAGSWGMLLTNSNSTYYNSGYHETTNSSVSSPIAIVNVNSDCLYLGTNNTARWRVEHDGHFIPLGSHDMGSTGRRIRTIYASNALNTSDRNEKNTITESDLGLDFICKLKPVSYKWNQKEGEEGEGLDTKTHYGLISQDVEEVIIETGKTLDDFGAVDKPDGDPMGLSYNEFISPLVKAIQEQQEQIKILQEKIAALEGS